VTGAAALVALPPPVTFTAAVRVPASKAVSPPVNATVSEVGDADTTLHAGEFEPLEALVRVTASAVMRGLKVPPAHVIVKLVASAGIVAGRATVNVSKARPSRHSNRSRREAGARQCFLCARVGRTDLNHDCDQILRQNDGCEAILNLR
jgi:hypothetical protein